MFSNLKALMFPLKSYNLVGLENSGPRNVWLEKTLRSIPTGLRILDAGAGELGNKKYCTHLKYVSQDFCQYDGTGDQKALQTEKWDTTRIDIISDITKIPEPDQSYDVILCSEVLEHLPDPNGALNEFQRLLKKDGRLIITAPFNSLTHFAPYHFSSGFNSYYYQHHFDQLGFKLESIVPNGNYFEYLAQEIHRLPEVAEKYANHKIGLVEKLILKFALKVIYPISRKDNGSTELLCFGYHVLARKT